MTTVRFFFAGGHVETHRLVGEWSREDIRQRAILLRAIAWE